MVSAIITDTIFLTCSHKCFLSLPINMFYFRFSQSHLYNIFIHPKHSENIKVAQAVLYYSGCPCSRQNQSGRCDIPERNP